MSRMLNQLRAAFMLLTRLPVARLLPDGGPCDLASCVWAFPLVGLTVNALGAVAYGLARYVGVPPLLAACWALAAIVLTTGALHEDGLADTADGFGGGATPARKLEIMRDSRIGSFGSLALIGSVAVRLAAMATLAGSWRVAVALCAGGTLGRAAIAVLLVMHRPVRADGLGAAMRDAPAGGVTLAMALAAVVALLLLPLATALVATLLALAAAFALGRLARAQIGGYTGDVLGAGAVFSECVALTAIAAMAGP